MTPPTLADRLSAARALGQGITPGEWGIERTATDNWVGPLRPTGKVDQVIVCTERGDGLTREASDRNDADAALLAAAKSHLTLIDDLAAALAEAVADRARVVEALAEYDAAVVRVGEIERGLSPEELMRLPFMSHGVAQQHGQAVANLEWAKLGVVDAARTALEPSHER